MKSKKIMFIASTGGHLNELLQLSPLFEEYESSIITEKTKSNMGLKSKYKNVDYLAWCTRHNLLKYILLAPYNIIKSLILFIKFNPRVVITTGTHTCVPMCYIAHIFRRKVIYIESFANSRTRTLSGRIVKPIADSFIIQWESMKAFYPDAILGGSIF